MQIDVYNPDNYTNGIPHEQGERTLRLADGPDEVHRILIAKNVLRQYAAGEGWDFGN